MQTNDIIAGKTLMTCPYYKIRANRKRKYVMAKCLCGNINEYMVYYLLINKDRVLKCSKCYNKQFGSITKNSKTII